MSTSRPSGAPAILRILEAHRVRYVAIGNYAAQLYGAPVATEDVDITPAIDDENLAHLAAALDELNAHIFISDSEQVPLPADGRLIARAGIWNLATDHGRLDIVVAPGGFEGGYDALLPQATRHRIGTDLSIAVAAFQDIITSKVAAGRRKDLSVLPVLEDHQRRLAAQPPDRPAP